jgi:hypothetical protein
MKHELLLAAGVLIFCLVGTLVLGFYIGLNY